MGFITLLTRFIRGKDPITSFLTYITMVTIIHLCRCFFSPTTTHLQGTKTQQRGKPQSMAVTLHHAAARALDPKSHAKRLFIFACCRRVFVTARATNFVTPTNHPAKWMAGRQSCGDLGQTFFFDLQMGDFEVTAVYFQDFLMAGGM